MRDAKGEALNYVSKKAKIEDEKVEVEGRNGGPTASIVIFKLRIKLWLKLRVRLPTVADDAVRNIINDVGVAQIVVTLLTVLNRTPATIYARDWRGNSPPRQY
jgi:hypothetical protein